MRLFQALTFALLLPAAAVAQSDFSKIALKIAQANKSSDAAIWNIASEQASIKAEVAPEDPEVAFAYIWPDDKETLNRWELEVSQTLPDFRRRKAAGKVVESLNLQKFNEMRAIDAENLYNAQTKLIELIGAKKNLDLMHSIHENFDSLSVSYQKAWNRGEVTILDLNKIRIEHARADAANIEATGQYSALIQEIIALSDGTVSAEELMSLTDYPVYENENALFGKIQECAVGPKRIRSVEGKNICPGCLPEPSSLSEGCYEDSELIELLMQSPQYLSYMSKINVANEKVNYASKSRFPQFSLGYKHTYEDGMHFNDLLAGMTIPIWSRKQEKIAAEGELNSLQAESQQAMIDMVAAVKADMCKAASLKRQLDALGPIVEQTNNVRLLQMALDGGEISLLDYLQEIGYFSDAIKEYNTARLDYSLTVASLARYF